MVRSVLTSENQIAETTVIQAAASRAWLQPWWTTMDAVTGDEIAPPSLPTVFIRAESEAENPGARAMQAAQKLAAANMVKPAASAIIARAIGDLGGMRSSPAGFTPR